MTGLVEFLRARLDEDAGVARAAGAGSWELDCDHDGDRADDDLPASHDMCATVSGDGFHIFDEGSHTPEQAAHIARWDPARVLAEVEAKRWITDTLVPEVEDMDETLHQEFCGTANPEAHNYIAAQLLRKMAQIYSDHPDYDPAWAVVEVSG